MAEELIFHECRALGVVFKTRKDWYEWLQKNSYDVYKPVATHDGFQYNINDVCINPNTIERKLDGNLFGWTVKTANTQFGWIWGYDINTPTNGSGCGASYPSRYDRKAQFFKTEKEAKLDALNYIIRQLEGMKPKTKNIALLIWEAKKVRQDIVHPQMELFK